MFVRQQTQICINFNLAFDFHTHTRIYPTFALTSLHNHARRTENGIPPHSLPQSRARRPRKSPSFITIFSPHLPFSHPKSNPKAKSESESRPFCYSDGPTSSSLTSTTLPGWRTSFCGTIRTGNCLNFSSSRIHWSGACVFPS